MSLNLSSDIFTWVIYDHPSDFPDVFVARKWSLRSNAPTQDVITSTSLEDLRSQLPSGLIKFLRAPSDDPCIVECWL